MKKDDAEIMVYVAVNHNEEAVILDVSNNLDITYFDGVCVSDNPFKNIELIPNEIGVYRLVCDFYYEPDDNDFELHIKKVEPLYLLNK
jgi:hypothetical protein